MCPFQVRAKTIDMIYADNAATTRLSKEALNAMLPYLTEEYGNASQTYSFSRGPKKAIQSARETIAECINAEPEEIFFTSGGTESDNWALKGMMLMKEEHRSLLTSQIEHHAILHSAASLERIGIPVTYLPVDNEGIVMPESLKCSISDNTKLVSIMLSNNETGSIQPIKELAAIAHSHGSLFHTDAVQAVGHIPVDVQVLNVDMLSASAHKFNGPKGIGFLYLRNNTPLNLFMDGGAQESGMRAGTENVASIVGMAAALQENVNAIDKVKTHLLVLENLLITSLRQVKIDFIRNGAEEHVPGNVSLSFKNSDGEMLLHRLDLMGICVSTGSACDSKNTQISHVLKAMHVSEEYARGTIRISLGKDNTYDDIESIVNGLVRILK